MTDGASPRKLFVCGLHRSGTSLIARAIAAHPEVASFKETHATEQEGQFLQQVIPTDEAFGGPGRFAFDPAAHLTETSHLATRQNAELIATAWAQFHDPGKAVLVEKSPPNLLRTRLLQALFPDASFIIVTRHPIPVSLATQKWTHTSPFSLISHWLRAHTLLEQDLPALRRAMVISYEGFVADPVSTLGRIWNFVSLPEHKAEIDVRDHNRAYFDRWLHDYAGARTAIEEPAGSKRLLQRLTKRLNTAPPAVKSLQRFQFGRRSDGQDAVLAFERAVRSFGYSLTDFSVCRGSTLDIPQKIKPVAVTERSSPLAIPGALR